MLVELLGGPLIPLCGETDTGSLFELMIHGVTLCNTEEQIARIEAVYFGFKKNTVVAENVFSGNRLKKYLAQNAEKFNSLGKDGDFIFPMVFGCDYFQMHPTPELPHGGKIIFNDLFFMFQNLFPNRFFVRVHYLAEGKIRIKTENFAISSQLGKNKYLLPLHGTNFLNRETSFGAGNCRNLKSMEFALELMALKENKKHLHAPKCNEDYAGYNERVYAAAPGFVEATCNHIDENILGSPLPLHELGKYTPEQALLGNYVVIKHANDEYSYLGSLKKGSVSVKEGAFVNRGQLVGHVGNTGLSLYPRLHFHLSDKPKLLGSRSLPAFFTDAYDVFREISGKELLCHRQCVVKSVREKHFR